MAGESQRDIKRRIRSVRNTQQITRAYQLVSGAKLRRVQNSVLQGKPYVDKLTEVLAQLAQANKSELTHPLLVQRPVARVAYCVVTGERGLAGGYNVNVARRAIQAMHETEQPYSVIVVGKKGREFFRKENYPVEAEFVGFGDDISWEEAQSVAARLTDDFIDGRVDAVYMVYTEFRSTINHVPVVKQLLPAGLAENDAPMEPKDSKKSARRSAFIVEPSMAEVLDVIVPRYIDTVVFRVLLEAKASEHAARMNAMRNATDNAEDMIEKLTLSFNRARQASITKEISEIVGGAEALSGE